MFFDDHSELQAQFKLVDQKDPDSVRKWFEDHKYLSVFDQCQIIGKSATEVRRLKYRAGIKCKTNLTHTKASFAQEIAEVPENWRTNREWIVENIKRYGVRAILRATKITRTTFYKTLKRLDIPVSKQKTGYKSKNPCCTRAWVYRHIIEMGMTRAECAKIAGITEQRLIDWLIRFRIHKLPFIIRVLYNKLVRQDIVRRVQFYPRHLRVFYRGGSRRYHYKYISADQWKVNKIPKLYHQYGYELDGTPSHPAHLAINRDEYEAATIFEKHLVMMQFKNELQSRGWIAPTYPSELILAAVEEIKHKQEKSFIKNGSFTIFTQRESGDAGRRLMFQFFDISSAFKTFEVIRYFRKSFYYLIKSPKDITTHNLIHMICLNRKIKFPNPALYATIFRRLKVTGKILDIRTGHGPRAIACLADDLIYSTIDPAFKEVALARGFDTMTGVRYEEYNENTIYDLVVCDYDHIDGDIDLALQYAKQAKQIMVYVPHEKKDEYVLKYKPRTILKVVNSNAAFRQKKLNYYFVW